MVPASPPFDSDDRESGLSISIVRSVAAHSNTPVEELPPLTDTIDPDALDALVDSMATGSVAFPYAAHVVTVAADGTVDVRPVAERTDNAP